MTGSDGQMSLGHPKLMGYARGMRLKTLSLLLFMIGADTQAAEPNPGLRNESEAGVIVTSGNARTQSFNFRQMNDYRWTLDALRFDGKFLRTSSAGTESARNWLLGLRYTRALTLHLSAYLGQNVESDVFAGFRQRYNSDLGARYDLLKTETFTLTSEGGFRRSIENRFTGQLAQSLVRLFLEANRNWTKTFSTRTSVEYLPNLTIESDYQVNFDLSASAAINEIFALKTGYTVKYRNVPVAPATEYTDTQLTTAVVAKF